MMSQPMPGSRPSGPAKPAFAHGMLRMGGEGMPAAAAPLLAPPALEICDSRLWYDTVLRHALPARSIAWLALVGPIGTMAVPLLEVDGYLRSLTTPYSLTWRPLIAAWAGPEAVEAAAAELGSLLRRHRPVQLKAIRPEEPWLDVFCAGLWRAGLTVQRFSNFGTYSEALPAGITWQDYLAAREQPLRGILRRKRARWEAETLFEPVQAPGLALENGIAAFEAVRLRSWRPLEPAPGFSAALMRAAADAGILRLGILRKREGGQALAVQAWILSGGRATATVMLHDEAARHLSPGTALTARMVAWLIEEGVSGIDLGRGEEAYKRLWARDWRQRIGLLVADPRNAAGMLALARHAAGRGRRRLLGLFGHRGTRENTR